MEKVFVVVWKDRYCDTDIIVYKNKDEAIKFAKDNANKLAKKYNHEIDEEINEFMKKDNWVYYGCYSCEGDNITVLERNIK